MLSINKSEILFIINPNSGKKKTDKIIKQILNVDPNISFIVTNEKKELEKVFNNDIDKYKVFVAVGGDGTVNEIAKYLYFKKDKVLAVVPNGSGNGFANELYFNNNIKSLINDIINGEILNIDILEVNNNKCINVAGIGFDSFVAHNFQKSKNRGLKNYIYSTIQSFFQFKPFTALLTSSNFEIRDKFQMITIANTRQFGNNAIISPKSKPNDGEFEVVLVKVLPLYYYPIFVIRLFRGNLKESKYIKFLNVSDCLSITSDFKKYHVDGEPHLTEGLLNIKICKHSVKVIKTSQNTL